MSSDLICDSFSLQTLSSTGIVKYITLFSYMEFLAAILLMNEMLWILLKVLWFSLWIKAHGKMY